MIRLRALMTSRPFPTEDLFGILFEDDEILVVNKPAGLVCHPTKGDVYSSLISRARLYLGENSKPHLVNRLDRETGGVLVVAKGPDTAGELARLWERREVDKEYLAIVYGSIAPDRGTIDAPLGKDEKSPVAIKDCVRLDGQAARTDFEVVQRFNRPDGAFSLLRVRPQTGRKHQIRIHLSSIGHLIVGDKLYGLDENFYLALVEGRLSDEDRRRLILPFQALHASSLAFQWRGRDYRFEAPPEAWFREFVGPATFVKNTGE